MSRVVLKITKVDGGLRPPKDKGRTVIIEDGFLRTDHDAPLEGVRRLQVNVDGVLIEICVSEATP